MQKVINLCKKQVKLDDGRVFDTYFAYRQEQNQDGVYTDVLTPMKDSEGKSIMRARPINVKLGDAIRKELENDNKFPYLVKLDDEMLCKDGKSAFFVTIDKDKNKKVRLDKNGQKHLVLVIREVVSYESVPHTSYSLDDIDNF